MTALPMLTEAECYLVSILDDPSGIELGEFLLVDEEQPDNCWRAWPHQWSMWRREETYQIDHCSRAVGKTQGILLRALAFIFNYPGQEMLITAPELNHLRPITDKIEHLLRSVRLAAAMLPRTRGQGINHQPQFQAHFINNARILSRLPNRDGRGLKGQHSLVIEFDEAQDMPEGGWVEVIETMKSASPGAQWRVHGVSRGVRDRYYRYTMQEDPDLPFYVHRYLAMHRPDWSDAERKAKIAIYGGTEDNIDYRRNIYGDHGDATSPVFVVHRLMACVRIAESSWAIEYNENVYNQVKINDEMLMSGAPIEQFCTFPGSHLDQKYFSYWLGADIGYTRDPTEILIFGELAHPKDKGESLLRLLTRIQLMRISAQNQAEVFRHAFNFYGDRLRRGSLDKTGNGLPLWQELDPAAVGTRMDLRRTPDHISRRIRGYNFSSKVAVEFDDRELVGKETQADAVISKNVVDFATDELRKLVDTGRIELPYDREILTEWQGQEIQYVRDEGSAAGIKVRYSGGSLHSLDAAKMLVAGKELMAIEEALKIVEDNSPVLARFG